MLRVSAMQANDRVAFNDIYFKNCKFDTSLSILVAIHLQVILLALNYYFFNHSCITDRDTELI